MEEISTSHLILAIFGGIFAITGIVFIYKGIGNNQTTLNIPVVGNVETTSSGIILFIVGAVMICAPFFKSGKDQDKISTSTVQTKNTLRLKVKFVDQFNNEVSDLNCVLLDVNQKDTFWGPVKSIGNGDLMAEPDTTKTDLTALLRAYSDDSVIRGDSFISIRSLGDLQDGFFKMKVKNNTPQPKKISVNNAAIEKMLRDSINMIVIDAQAQNKLKVHYDESPMEYDKDDPKKCVYNFNGKVVISYCGNPIYYSKASINPTNNIPMPESHVRNYLAGEVQRIVAQEKNSMFQEIKKHIQ